MTEQRKMQSQPKISTTRRWKKQGMDSRFSPQPARQCNPQITVDLRLSASRTMKNNCQYLAT
jgi:hypothetical protein